MVNRQLSWRLFGNFERNRPAGVSAEWPLTQRMAMRFKSLTLKNWSQSNLFRNSNASHPFQTRRLAFPPLRLHPPETFRAVTSASRITMPPTPRCHLEIIQLAAIFHLLEAKCHRETTLRPTPLRQATAASAFRHRTSHLRTSRPRTFKHRVSQMVVHHFLLAGMGLPNCRRLFLAIFRCRRLEIRAQRKTIRTEFVGNFRLSKNYLRIRSLQDAGGLPLQIGT